MKTNEIHKAVKAYLRLIQEYYARGGEQITFDKGYWWTLGDTDMQAFEKQFLSYGSDWQELHAAWRDAHSASHRANILHLIGWSSHITKTAPILIQSLKDPSTAVSNAAARSLFPLVVSGTYRLDISVVISLMHRRSKYHRNKALGFLLYWPDIDELRLHVTPESHHIRMLAEHNAAMYSPLAQAVLERIGS